VTALLFRIKVCTWDVPVGDKTEIKPMRVQDMDLKAAKLNKGKISLHDIKL